MVYFDDHSIECYASHFSREKECLELCVSPLGENEVDDVAVDDNNDNHDGTVEQE